MRIILCKLLLALKLSPETQLDKRDGSLFQFRTDDKVLSSPKLFYLFTYSLWMGGKVFLFFFLLGSHNNISSPLLTLKKK